MKSYRKNGKLIIEIDEGVLLTCGQYAFGEKHKIVNEDAFLDFCCMKVLEVNVGVDQGNDGKPIMHQLMDDVINCAVEGAEGLYT